MFQKPHTCDLIRAVPVSCRGVDPSSSRVNDDSITRHQAPGRAAVEILCSFFK